MSILKVDTIQTTSGAGLTPARAWVNFNGTGTLAIRADGNVSSITDEGVARYRILFDTALPNANYAVVTGTSGGGNFVFIQNNNGTIEAPTTTSMRIWTPGVIADPEYVNLAVFN
jgi:hypothetical protein